LVARWVVARASRWVAGRARGLGVGSETRSAREWDPRLAQGTAPWKVTCSVFVSESGWALRWATGRGRALEWESVWKLDRG